MITQSVIQADSERYSPPPIIQEPPLFLALHSHFNQKRPRLSSVLMLTLHLSPLLWGNGCFGEHPRLAKESAHQRTKSLSATPENKQKKRHQWLFVGDSLTAGFGVNAEEAYPAHLQRLFVEQGLSWTLRNAGVSGDTSAGVRRRIDWLVDEQIHTVFLCIGANDGLRGQPPTALKENLLAIVQQIQHKGARVILAGMKMPPSMGKVYATEFEAVYHQVAQAKGLPFMPFLLEEVAGVRQLNQADGIHPNRKGHELIATQVMAFLSEGELLQ